ncbi:hypothetical protein CapIbe_020239 [Capra ibex]
MHTPTSGCKSSAEQSSKESLCPPRRFGLAARLITYIKKEEFEKPHLTTRSPAEAIRRPCRRTSRPALVPVFASVNCPASLKCVCA